MASENNNKHSPTTLEADEEQGISILDAGSPGVTNMSTVTFGSVPIGSGSTQTTGTARKINKHDVKAVFKASHTTATASNEQIQRIKMMHQKIDDGIKWNFNYSCLSMVASVVAALGLATDSSTTVISSMLLSPIM